MSTNRFKVHLPPRLVAVAKDYAQRRQQYVEQQKAELNGFRVDEVRPPHKMPDFNLTVVTTK